MGAACFFYHGEDDVSTPERPIPVPKWLADQAKQEGIDVIEDGVALKPRSGTLAHSCLPASAREDTHSAGSRPESAAFALLVAGVVCAVL